MPPLPCVRLSTEARAMSETWRIALLFAVAVDHRLLACQHQVGEDGDDACFAMRILPRPVDIGIAEHGVVDAKVDFGQEQVMRVKRIDGVVLGDRQARGEDTKRNLKHANATALANLRTEPI